MATASVIFDIVGRDRASDKFDKVGNSVDRSGGKMAKFGKVAKIAAFGLAAGASAAGVGLFKLAQGAAEDAAGQARLAQALRNSTGATNAQVAGVEDWISKQGEALGVADDQLRPALEKLAIATGDVGKAQKLAALAMDVSAGSGKSMEAVSAALAKAQNGQVAGLAKLGISTKDAHGKTISFAEAQKRLAAAHGGQASKAANTLQGKLGRLKLIMAEAGETIGAKVLPPATKLATFMVNNLGPGIGKVGKFLGEHKTALKVAGIALGVFAGALVVANAAIWAYTATTKIITVATKAWGAAQWVLNAAMRANPIGIVITALVALGAGLVLAYKKSDTFRAIVQGAFAKVKAVVSAFAGFFTKTIPNAFGKVVGFFRGGGDRLKGVARATWNGLKSLVKLGITAQVDLIRSLPGKIVALAGKMLNAGKTIGSKIFEGLKKGISGVASVVGDISTAVMNKLKDLINGVIGKINEGIPNKLGWGKLAIDLPDNPIPKLARGGPVKKGQPYIVGDRGPRSAWELFVPDQDGQVQARVPQAAGGRAVPMAGGAPVVHHHHNVVVNIPTGFVGNEGELAKRIEQMLVRRTRAVGRPLAFQAR